MSTLSTILMILAILYFLVIPSFKTGVFSVKKLMIAPAIFLYMNYESLQRHFHIHIQSMDSVLILAGIIFGVMIGAFLRKNTLIRADREKSLIEVPGSYFSLVIFIAIFSVHFVIGYLESVSPGYLLQVSLAEQGLMFLLTLSSCMSIGSNGCLFYKYHTTTSTQLAEPK